MEGVQRSKKYLILILFNFFIIYFGKKKDENEHNFNNNFDKQNCATFSNAELSEIKLKQSKRKKSKQLLKEIIINFVFLYVLFVACYSNRDENYFTYAGHLKTIFNDYNDVMKF